MKMTDDARGVCIPTRGAAYRTRVTRPITYVYVMHLLSYSCSYSCSYLVRQAVDPVSMSDDVMLR